MDNNILKFPSNTIDSNTEKTWEVVVKTIEHDFTTTGFPQFIDEFKEVFRPVFELFVVKPLEVPLFPETGFEAWKSTTENLVREFQEHNAKLLKERYLHELQLFCETRLSE